MKKAEPTLTEDYFGLGQTFNPATYVPELDLNSVKDKTWFYNQFIIVDHGDPQQGELNLKEVA